MIYSIHEQEKKAVVEYYKILDVLLLTVEVMSHIWYFKSDAVL